MRAARALRRAPALRCRAPDSIPRPPASQPAHLLVGACGVAVLDGRLERLIQVFTCEVRWRFSIRSRSAR